MPRLLEQSSALAPAPGMAPTLAPAPAPSPPPSPPLAQQRVAHEQDEHVPKSPQEEGGADAMTLPPLGDGTGEE